MKRWKACTASWKVRPAEPGEGQTYATEEEAWVRLRAETDALVRGASDGLAAARRRLEDARRGAEEALAIADRVDMAHFERFGVSATAA